MDAAQSSHTTVTIRIDTEPDYKKNYDEVDPDMITKLLDLFREEGIHATFVTCARLAEQQTEVLRQAEGEGHEIAVHAYDHEQIDALSEEADRRDRSRHRCDARTRLSPHRIWRAAQQHHRRGAQPAHRARLLLRRIRRLGPRSRPPSSPFSIS